MMYVEITKGVVFINGMYVNLKGAKGVYEPESGGRLHIASENGKSFVKAILYKNGVEFGLQFKAFKNLEYKEIKRRPLPKTAPKTKEAYRRQGMLIGYYEEGYTGVKS